MYHYLTYQTRKAPNGQPSPAENLRKVFISYKKADDFVSCVRDTIANTILEYRDVAIWKDTNLTPGLDYDKEIQQAIAESDVVVLLLTENVMESAYIWEKEIPMAQKMEKGIIPIRVGITDAAFLIADQKLVHKHCLTCPTTASGKFQPDEEFKDALKRALDVHIMDIDLVNKINQFFISEKHKLSVRHLSYEQIFYMGCGYMTGIGTEKNTSISIPMLKSILHGYGNDPDFSELKCTVAKKLFFHYAESNHIDGIREYALLALEYGDLAVINEINRWYNEDMHSQLLSSMEFRAAFYQAVKQFGLREGFSPTGVPKSYTVSLTPQKEAPTGKKKAVFCANGHEFCLMAKKSDVPRLYGGREKNCVYLMRDDMAIDHFLEAYICNALFLYYDAETQTIYVMESDFDNHGPDTEYIEYRYQNIFGETVQRQRQYLGTDRGFGRLPYELPRWHLPNL